MNIAEQIICPDVKEWLKNSLRLVAPDFEIHKMFGSNSSSVFLVKVTGGYSSIKDRFVLRVIDHAEWLAEEPDLAEHEAAALDEAKRLGLPAPELIAHSSQDVGFGAPVVLMSFIEGKIELRPANISVWLRELASKLASIHRHPASAFPWSCWSWLDKHKLAVPEWTTNQLVWERAIEFVLHQAPPESPSVFLHRDYHPTNVLWDEDRVSGVVDWIKPAEGQQGLMSHTAEPISL